VAFIAYIQEQRRELLSELQFHFLLD